MSAVWYSVDMYLRDIQKENMHHAYCIAAPYACVDAVCEHIASLCDVALTGNPDVLIMRTPALNAEDARKVVHVAGESAFVSSAKKIIILAFSTITIEAQNILLKTLEEPPHNTYLFLITPLSDTLLPTVLSRCVKVRVTEDTPCIATEQSAESTAFVAASPKERLNIIARIQKRKNHAENKALFLEILHALESEQHMHMPPVQDIQALHTWADGMRAIWNAKRYLQEKGAMSKMLMESVALMV